MFPPAANDNLPPELRPRTAREEITYALSEPAAFFLYLFGVGFVVTSGYSLVIALAVRFG